MLIIARRREQGFTLVELMVALVLGLLVMAAVIALVLAVVRSNRQTLQSTRLNQELRATLNLIANDLRRARSVDDPLTNIDAVTFHDIRTSVDGDCINFGFERRGIEDTVPLPEWHTLFVDGGRLYLRRETASPVTVNCAAGGVRPLSSNEITIDTLRFDRPIPPGSTAPPDDVVREIVVTVTGRINSTNPASVTTRSMAQTVYVRSVGAGI